MSETPTADTPTNTAPITSPGHVVADDTPAASPGETPSVGLAEASRLCGVSKPTIRRRAADLTAYGATVSDHGWSIPITALVAVGLLDSITPGTGTKTRPVTPLKAPVIDPVPSPGSFPQVDPGELDRLRTEAADWRRRAEVAEAVAAERERTIEAQAMALRMLEAPRPQVTPADEHQALLPTRPEVTKQEPSSPAKRRWWRSA